MRVDDLRAAGHERWQQRLDEAAVRRARSQQAEQHTIRPQLARELVRLAAWPDPAVKPVRQARRSA